MSILSIKKSYPQFIHSLSTGLVLLLLLAFSINTVSSYTLTQEFQAGVVLEDQDFYGIPSSLYFKKDQKDEAVKHIQEVLEKNNSFLAGYKTKIHLDSQISFMNSSLYVGVNKKYDPNITLSSYLNKEVSAAEIIWILAQTEAGWACSNSSLYRNLSTDGLFCSDENINPYFILALIQKESGLIYGRNARLDPKSDQAVWLLDRVIGYYCLETLDKTKGCYDENPNWKYYKGFFAQLYWGIRWMKIVAESCSHPDYAPADIGKFRSVFSHYKNKLDSDGNVVYENGKPVLIPVYKEVLIETAFACAHYWYTPNISGSKLLYDIYKEVLPNERLICNQTIINMEYKTTPIVETPKITKF